ncbi:MAG: AfsR/SARP family transcriptional regulator [Acidimicrobiales bacterium]
MGEDTTVPEQDLPGTHGRVLLAALALAHGPITSDTLAEHIWPQDMPPDWAKSLAPLVSRIRGQLAIADPTGGSTIKVASGYHELVLPSDVWIDLEDATTRLDRAEGAIRHGDPAAAWTDAAPASAILRRPLLPGFDAPWVDQWRSVLGDRQHRTWIVLARAWLALGDAALARTAAHSAIELDPYREEGHRQLIRAELAAGNRAGAVRAAAACRDLLRDDLGVEPSSETLELERLALG